MKLPYIKGLASNELDNYNDSNKVWSYFFLLRNKGGKDKRALIITIKRSLVKSLKIYQLSTTVLLSSTDRKSDHVKWIFKK